jgi:hypothetical protein
METLSATQKQLRYDAINNLSNILWSKYQKPVSKYKKLSVTQMQYMYDQLMHSEKELNLIHEEALKLN